MDLSFQRFDDRYLPELMRWFPDESSCSVWGGPHFRFPYTPTTFREDVGIDIRPAWMLVTSERSLAAFGQAYLRAGRCHLGHLVVAPERRALGIGARLIRELCAHGGAELGTDEYSLFVLPQNTVALSLYQRLGFTPVPYPEPLPTTLEMVYMVAVGRAAVTLRSG